MENFLQADAELVVSLMVDCDRRKVTQESIIKTVLARFAFVFQPPEIEDVTLTDWRVTGTVIFTKPQRAADWCQRVMPG